MIYIATAGWSIPASAATWFPATGTHLARYAQQFCATEINSTFYRAHKPATFEQWAESVPELFRFSVKIPREITHEQRLVDVSALLEIFLLHATCLGNKLGCLLVQLPPSLDYNRPIARKFFEDMRQHYAGPIAVEPRHPTWFTKTVEQQLTQLRIARVAADPAVVPEAAVPGGFPDLVYLRLHGSPRIYYSAYGEDALSSAAAILQSAYDRGADAWCVFDNTASGAAATDALKLQALLPSVTCSIHTEHGPD